MEHPSRSCIQIPGKAELLGPAEILMFWTSLLAMMWELHSHHIIVVMTLRKLLHYRRAIILLVVYTLQSACHWCHAFVRQTFSPAPAIQNSIHWMITFDHCSCSIFHLRRRIIIIMIYKWKWTRLGMIVIRVLKSSELLTMWGIRYFFTRRWSHMHC